MLISHQNVLGDAVVVVAESGVVGVEGVETGAGQSVAGIRLKLSQFGGLYLYIAISSADDEVVDPLQMADDKLFHLFRCEIDEAGQIHRRTAAVCIVQHLARLNWVDQNWTLLVWAATHKQIVHEHDQMHSPSMSAQGVDGLKWVSVPYFDLGVGGELAACAEDSWAGQADDLVSVALVESLSVG